MDWELTLAFVGTVLTVGSLFSWWVHRDTRADDRRTMKQLMERNDNLEQEVEQARLHALHAAEEAVDALIPTGVTAGSLNRLMRSRPVVTGDINVVVNEPRPAEMKDPPDHGWLEQQSITGSWGTYPTSPRQHSSLEERHRVWDAALRSPS